MQFPRTGACFVWRQAAAQTVVVVLIPLSQLRPPWRYPHPIPEGGLWSLTLKFNSQMQVFQLSLLSVSPPRVFLPLPAFGVRPSFGFGLLYDREIWFHWTLLWRAVRGESHVSPLPAGAEHTAANNFQQWSESKQALLMLVRENLLLLLRISVTMFVRKETSRKKMKCGYLQWVGKEICSASQKLTAAFLGIRAFRKEPCDTLQDQYSPWEL